MIYILLATYNGEKYLREQIDSLIQQTYQNWKLFIHDDNSKDSTRSILLEYSNLYPNKIFFLDDNIACGGAKENFSYLLEKIDNNYDYVMFCDQDDIWLRDRINKFYLTMKKNEKTFGNNIPLVVFSDLKIVDDKLQTINDSMIKYQKLNPKIAESYNLLMCQNVITGCAMIINKKAIMLAIPMPRETIMHDWWIGLVVAKYGKNIYLNEVTILYRQHQNNVFGAKRNTFFGKLLSLFSAKQFKQYKKVKKMSLKIEPNNLNFIFFIFYKLKGKL